MAKNFVQEGKNLTLPVGTGVKSGDPVAVGEIVGVALTNADDNGYATVQTEGVFKLSVVGNDGTNDASISVGDALYYNAGTINKNTAGVLFGYALEAVGAGETKTIDVLIARK